MPGSKVSSTQLYCPSALPNLFLCVSKVLGFRVVNDARLFSATSSFIPDCVILLEGKRVNVDKKVGFNLHEECEILTLVWRTLPFPFSFFSMDRNFLITHGD